MPTTKERFEYRVSDTESVIIEGTRNLPSRFLSRMSVTSTIVTDGETPTLEYKGAVDGVTSLLLALYAAGMMERMSQRDIQTAVTATFDAIANILGDD